MSSTVDGISSTIALDPRVANSPGHYFIEKGATSVNYFRNAATSYSDSSIIFSLIPPSKDVYVSKKMYLDLACRFTLTGDAGVGNTIVDQQTVAPWGDIMVSQTDGLAFMPLQARACENFSLQLNQQTISGNMKDWLAPLCLYGYGKEDDETFMSTGPSKPDQFVRLGNWAALGDARNSLSSYGASEFQNRGSFLYRIVSNTQFEAVVDVEWTEQLMLSPLQVQNKDEQGFIGLNNLTLNLSLSRLERMWNHDSQNGSTVTSIAGTIQQRPQLRLCYLTPPLMSKASLNNTYPYYQVERYQTDNNSSLAAGSSEQYVSNNVQLSSVPKRVYIYARKRDSDRSGFDADGYAAIRGIDVQFNNMSGILSSADERDLYDLSCRNGLTIPWTAWRYWLGGVMCLDFSRDIGLNELVSCGMQGQYNLQVTCNIENISDEPVTYTLFMVVVSEGSVKIVGTEVSKSVGAVVPQNLFQDLDAIESIPFHPESRNFYGGVYSGAGSFWSKLKKFGHKVAKGVETAAPYALQAAKYIAPLLAAGYSETETVDAVASRMGGQLSKGEVSRMVKAAGGRRMSKSSLMNRA